MKKLDHISSIYDLRHYAQKKLPKMFFDYIERGSFAEVTVNKNITDFNRYCLRQSAFQSVQSRHMKATVLGEQYDLPFGFGPTGLMGMFWPNAEIEAAKITEKYNIPFCLSTMSICSLEDVAKHRSNPFWFQLYMLRNRDLVYQLIERAKHVGVSALLVNADLPATGVRYCDIKNGMTVPPRLTIKNAINICCHPSWALRYMTSTRKNFGNLQTLITGGDDIKTITRYMNTQYDPSVTWDDIKKLRDKWQGKFVIKGILDVESAKKALEIGVDAIVVSNHGGRQLDGVISSIDALASMANKVLGDMEILFDGGIRTGPDMMRALALGAKFNLLARPLLYGISAFGPKGLEKAIQLLKNELDVSMALAGVASVNSVNSAVITTPNKALS